MAEQRNKVTRREPRLQRLPNVGDATTTTHKPIAPGALRSQRAMLMKSLMGRAEYERFESLMTRQVRTPETTSEGEQKRA